MAYGGDITVFVEEKAGDLGAPGNVPFWLSPDIDIPAHSGEAVQGANQVQVRVHAHDEPFLTTKIIAEVYVGKPSLVLSPTTGTQRIDPGDLLYRQPGTTVTGPEPTVDDFGATRTFSWTPSASAAAIDGPGHRCLIVRAYPLDVTPPNSPFDVPNERHEAQHNIEILTTTTHSAKMSRGGAGTKKSPRKRDKETGLWWEELVTLAAGKRGRRYIACALDPEPGDEIVGGLRKGLREAKVGGFSQYPPSEVRLEALDTRGEAVDPRQLLKNRKFASQAGLGGKGLFTEDRLLSAMAAEFGPRKPVRVVLRFDHSNIPPKTAAVMHVVQWDENGRPEGGMTIVAAAPVVA
jgi:hypothetical protein